MSESDSDNLPITQYCLCSRLLSRSNIEDDEGAFETDGDNGYESDDDLTPLVLVCDTASLSRYSRMIVATTSPFQSENREGVSLPGGKQTQSQRRRSRRRGKRQRRRRLLRMRRTKWRTLLTTMTTTTTSRQIWNRLAVGRHSPTRSRANERVTSALLPE